MNKKEKWTIYIIFLVVYFISAIYSFLNKSQWLIDAVAAIALLTFVFLICEWFKMEKKEFILFNSALLIHVLGTFRFYELNFGLFAYDDVVHLISSAIAAYIIFNFIVRKIKIKKAKHSIIKENKVIFMFLVIASVAMLGVVVELIEYVGFMYFGPGEGILFVGSGDGAIESVAGQYLDTMRDIIMNTIGSFIGGMIFYYSVYKKKPWLKY